MFELKLIKIDNQHANEPKIGLFKPQTAAECLLLAKNKLTHQNQMLTSQKAAPNRSHFISNYKSQPQSCYSLGKVGLKAQWLNN